MKAYLNIIASTRFLLALLSLSLLLGLFATIEQQRIGSIAAIEKYIHVFIVSWKPQGMNVAIPVFLGGYTIMILFVLNLIAQSIIKFQSTVKRVGATLINTGAALLVVAYLTISSSTVESQSLVTKRKPIAYAEDLNHFEVVLSNTTAEESNRTYAIPQVMLERSQTIRHIDLPFSIRIDAFSINSLVKERNDLLPSDTPLANQGRGKTVYAVPLPAAKSYLESNNPSALVTLFEPDRAIGAWLVKNGWPPQAFEYNDTRYSLQLRPMRHYLPFSVQLDNIGHNEELTPVSKLIIFDNDKASSSSVEISPTQPTVHNGYRLYKADYSLSNQEILVTIKNVTGLQLPPLAYGFIILGALIRLAANYRERNKDETQTT